MIEKNPFHPAAPDLDPSLLSDPAVMLIGAGLLIAILISLSIPKGRPKRGRSRPWSRRAVMPFKRDMPNRAPLDRQNMHLPENQVRAVAEAQFETQPLLNKSEARLLPVIEAALAAIGRGHRVMAQTSVGELLRPRRGQAPAVWGAAYAAINSKRFDFAIIDRFGRLVAAIEYQGAGHYRNTSFIRDAVKREACRKAGVAFIEVKEGTYPGDLTEQLRGLLDRTPATRAKHRETPRRDQRKPSAAS